MTIFSLALNPSIDKILEVRDFAVGGTFPVLSRSQFPLGKAISFALVARLLGETPRVVGLVGESDRELYEAFLHQHAVSCDFVTVPGATRSNTTIVDPVNHSVTHLREAGFHATKHHVQRVFTRLDEEVRANDWLVLSGSLPPGVPARTYEDLVAYFRARGAHCVLDTSGLALRFGARARPSMIKPNLAEAGELLGEELVPPRDLESAMPVLEALLEHAPAFVLLTLAERGAIVATREACLWMCVEVPDPVNTVGCGDSFLAGFVVARVRGESLLEATRLAVACGAANALRSGAGLLALDDVTALRARVELVAQASLGEQA